MLLAKMFHRSSKLSESAKLSKSLAENGDGPQESCWRVKKQISWTRFTIAPTEMTQLFGYRRNLIPNGGYAATNGKKKDGLVLHMGKIYVPHDGQLRLNIVKAHHNYLISGHPSWWKMMELIAHNFWWPRMGCYMVDYMKGCNLCNHTKTYPISPSVKLRSN